MAAQAGKGAVEWLPSVAMVAVQAGFAGLNVVSKLALDSGMSPFVLIAYRQIIATVALAPIAFFIERSTNILLLTSISYKFPNEFSQMFFARKNLIKITGGILLQILFCSTFGATLNQLLYFIGLKYTTPTIACALTNILPAITFIMAVPFRIETAEMESSSGKAKVVGTALCVGGSMLMTFYKGALVHVPPSGIHWRYAEEAAARGGAATMGSGKEVVGAMLVVGSCVAWAAWFILQAKMSKTFSAPYTSSTLMCAMAGVECLIIGVAAERNLSRWALGFDIRLASVLYIGLVGSGLAVSLMTWAIEKRGPLYVSMFSPLLLIVVALVGWAILDEKLHVGSALGSVIIVIGLYLVLWGKGREFRESSSDGTGAMEAEENGGAEGSQGIKMKGVKKLVKAEEV